MKKIFYKLIGIIAITVVCVSSYAQDVQIVEKNDNFIQKEKVVKFEFINESFDLTKHEKVAVLKGYSKCSGAGKNSLRSLFNKFKKMSNKLGANSYFIDIVERTSDTIFVQISVYYFDSTTFEDNLKMFPKNIVYVFGDFDFKRGKTMKLKLNGENIELANFQYIETQNEVGKYVTVSIGGFLGAKVEIYGREERLPEYLLLDGAGVGPGNSSQSISVSTGKIYPLQMDFGQFLINILTPKTDNASR